MGGIGIFTWHIYCIPAFEGTFAQIKEVRKKFQAAFQCRVPRNLIIRGENEGLLSINPCFDKYHQSNDECQHSILDK